MAIGYCSNFCAWIILVGKHPNYFTEVNMRKKSLWFKLLHLPSQSGQSLVLVAFLFIGLMAFVGIAVDVGFVYARNAQLSAAVDAAALAGVVELNGPNRLPFADEKAAEYLYSQGRIPASAINATFENPNYHKESVTTLGSRHYSITVTWPVELFFLRVIGQNTVNLRKTATAAQFPLADIYASQRVEDGALSTSNQAVFGFNSCVGMGDPFSPILDNQANTFRQTWRGDPSDRTYHYRILIPPTYDRDLVRVELFDPDSMNQANNSGGSYSATVPHTVIAQTLGAMPISDVRSCTATQQNPCLINTGEFSAVRNSFPSGTNLTDIANAVNMWWFVRIDENRSAGGSAPGNGSSCGTPGSYNVGYNTITKYDLFYYRGNSDGSISKQMIASYYGQAGDFVTTRGGYPRDNSFSSGNHLTDLRWVAPGGTQGSDQPAIVPSACGSPNGGDYNAVTCPGGSQPGAGNGFEVVINGANTDVPGILVDGTTSFRYLYLDVTAQSGASENGYEIWAGPSDYVTGLNGASTVPSDVNARNVMIINTPAIHSSRGISVFGLGHLPMNSNLGANWDGNSGNDPVDIPLIFVGAEYAGTRINLSLYDSDSGAAPPVVFYFDSLGLSTWSKTFSDYPTPDPDGGTGRCTIGSCNALFVSPPYSIQVPDLTDACTDPSSAAQADICTPFYGGRLVARYIGGTNDTYHWDITLQGLPYLIK